MPLQSPGEARWAGVCTGPGPSTFVDKLGLHATLLPGPEGGNKSPGSGADHLCVPTEGQGLSQVQEPGPHCRDRPM